MSSLMPTLLLPLISGEFAPLMVLSLSNSTAEVIDSCGPASDQPECQRACYEDPTPT